MADQEEEDSGKKKKSAMMQMIIGFAVLTVVGAGAGWVIGNMAAQQILRVEKAANAQKQAEATPAADSKGESGGEGEATGLQKISTEANGIVQLEPITTNLAYPSENWIRIEVALLFKDKPDVSLAEDIHQDILAYLRTVSLQQIEGPRGFEYLKEDIQERVDLRSEGRVSKVLFRTFVLE